LPVTFSKGASRGTALIGSETTSLTRRPDPYSSSRQASVRRARAVAGGFLLGAGEQRGHILMPQNARQGRRGETEGSAGEGSSPRQPSSTRKPKNCRNADALRATLAGESVAQAAASRPSAAASAFQIADFRLGPHQIAAIGGQRVGRRPAAASMAKGGDGRPRLAPRHRLGGDHPRLGRQAHD
jgi:hypothetical protein